MCGWRPASTQSFSLACRFIPFTCLQRVRVNNLSRNNFKVVVERVEYNKRQWYSDTFSLHEVGGKNWNRIMHSNYCCCCYKNEFHGSEPRTSDCVAHHPLHCNGRHLLARLSFVGVDSIFIRECAPTFGRTACVSGRLAATALQCYSV